jgi:MYXO-CTERM domain-containing protein
VRWGSVVCLLLPGVAFGGVEDWRVNEVVPVDDGDADFRFIELYAPPSDVADNCLFPTSRIEVFDAAGGLVGAVSPTTSTRCFAGNTYFLFATAEAATHWGVARDATLTVTIPGDAGQVCFASSATRYDCTRWGTISMAIPDLYDPDDTTAGPSIPDGQGLSRRSDSGIVEDDFVLQAPTPRQPNDGTVWYPPDGGLPDAAPIVDAAIFDAREFADAPPRPMIDSRTRDPNWFLADPGGGAICTCRVGSGGRRPAPAWAPIALLLLLALRKRGSLR